MGHVRSRAPVLRGEFRVDVGRWVLVEAAMSVLSLTAHILIIRREHRARAGPGLPPGLAILPRHRGGRASSLSL